MRRTNLYLDERQTLALDEMAHARGISRAELVRRIIDRELAGKSSRLEADLAAIRDSFGVLRGEAPFVRGAEDRDAYLDGLWRP
ncbi:MAG: CopG family transcriptional regulator [Candidatus Dormiibacterota bacterium]